MEYQQYIPTSLDGWWQIKAFYYKIAYSWQPNSWPVVQIPTQINNRIPYPCIFFQAGAFVQKLQFVISFIFNPLRAKKNDIHYDRGRDFVNGSRYFC